MNKCLSAAVAATLALATGACMQQSTPQQLNTTNANSRIFIGSLTCNVAGGTGYVLGSSKSLDCVFLSKDGVQSAQYTGTINKVGIDIGYTKAVHTIWRVYSLWRPQRGDRHARLRHRAGRGLQSCDRHRRDVAQAQVAAPALSAPARPATAARRTA
jgi:hypothetical protein